MMPSLKKRGWLWRRVVWEEERVWVGVPRLWPRWSEMVVRFPYPFFYVRFGWSGGSDVRL